MKVFFDTEFIEDGRTIELVSIGMVREDGAEFYAESMEVDLSRGDDWMRENVYPHLTGVTMARRAIAENIVAFVGFAPEFWASHADYDWVVLCQLYGRMIDLPKGWPKFCRDLKQWRVELGDPKIPVQDTVEHNALADARWNKQVYDFLLPMRQRAEEPRS